jgi:hypothetical protein
MPTQHSAIDPVVGPSPSASPDIDSALLNGRPEDGRPGSGGPGAPVPATPTPGRDPGLAAGAAGPIGPVNPTNYDGGVEALVSTITRQIGATIKPGAAVAVTFGFPLILMIAVLLFLLVQSRLDDHDPKLRVAPLKSADTILVFQDEDLL